MILMVLSPPVFAQIGPLRAAQARMDKGKWIKSENSIEKALGKDPANAEAKLVYAQWYFSPGNPKSSIDSAYKFVLAATEDYDQADPRQKEKLQRFPLDSAILVRLRERIDSAAFERAKQYNSEGAYIAFLRRFTYAKQRKNAIELRDEVSFLDALRENTYQGFARYMEKYPESHRFGEASDRYEKLLFEDRTRDGKLKSYISFYREFPHSPFRGTALKQIFEVGTASGELQDFLEFISQYKGAGPLTKRARDMALHIALQQHRQIPAAVLSDSVRQVLEDDGPYWVPFLKNGKYGFMDSDGKEKIGPEYEGIDGDYLCGNITEDFLITSKGVVSRSNKLLIGGEVEAVEDLGYGILLVGLKGCSRLVHKSGFALVPGCVDAARIVAGHFLAVERNKKWTLHAFTGRQLIGQAYDGITSEGDIVVLGKSGKQVLNTIDQVIFAADNNPLPGNMVFDEVRKLSSDKILVKNGSLEGVVGPDLKFVVPLDRQELTLTSFGFTKKVLNKVTTVGLSDAIDRQEFVEIRPYLHWLGLYQPKAAKLFDLPSRKVVEDGLDSLWFANRLAMAASGDSLKVMFGSGRKMLFPKSMRVAFVKSPDSVRFFYLEGKDKKQVYGVDSGARLFSLEFDHIEEIESGVFLITHKNKKGIVGLDGKPILPVEYDAIVKASPHVVSLLKDKKFGLFDIRRRQLFKAIYDRNLFFFNASTLVAYKDGFYGFMDLDSAPISPFQFDEVRPWSDSVALVRKDFRWMTYSVYDGKTIIDQIKSYRLIKDAPDGKIAIIQKGNDYGVLSSTRGMIIPPTFSDLLNLGTAEKPFYFTEKHVEEAGIFVVIYYDEQGRLVRRQIYEADEYDDIYCK